ncbi:MAG: hypothetical protein ACE5LV_10030 [Candidatus Aminicenantales bacterium]
MRPRFDLISRILYGEDMVTGILKIILYALLAYLVYVFIRAYRMITQRPRRRPQVNRTSGIMVKDDVCNTYLPVEEALKETVGEKVHYFCSRECRQKFLESRS